METDYRRWCRQFKEMSCAVSRPFRSISGTYRSSEIFCRLSRRSTYKMYFKINKDNIFPSRFVYNPLRFRIETVTSIIPRASLYLETISRHFWNIVIDARQPCLFYLYPLKLILCCTVDMWVNIFSFHINVEIIILRLSQNMPNISI